jgi:hypothetical protein
VNPELTDLPDYQIRWRKGVGNSPWRGIFAENVERVRITNVFSRNDQLLELEPAPATLEPWHDSQLAQKPCLTTVGPCVLDDSFGLGWALVQPLARDASYLTPWSRSTASTAERAEKTRQWAELSFWFQPVSGTAGWQKILPQTIQNIDLTVEGGDGGYFSGYESHNYIVARSFSKLFGRFAELSRVLMPQ